MTDGCHTDEGERRPSGRAELSRGLCGALFKAAECSVELETQSRKSSRRREFSEENRVCLVTLYRCVPAYSRGITWDNGQRTNPRVTRQKRGLFPL
ncbi:hypothetical protein U0070_027317 [Myodes glareolus]|uniref:Uncharacterized protein n=1 Tax=Myodes glareolus TaxID=447135 RepID=A0AAW0HVW0_MYOGA